MKRILKYLINNFLAKVFITSNERKIEKKILESDLISFDIFDTLIIRKNCGKPTDIFKMVEDEYNKENESNKINFYKDRIISEKEARKKKNNQEISLKDIYNQLPYNKKTKERLKELELRIEQCSCIAKPNIYRIYEFCVKNNKEIIIVSDMYLDKRIINKILLGNGYLNCNKVYISSETNLQKSNGKIFKFLKKEYKGKKILHIGDNFISDYLNPKSSNIKSILIK